MKVCTQDGAARDFHAGHIKDGVRHGFVYAGKKRVYGTIPVDGGEWATFTPTGKHASLLTPQFPVVDEVDLVVTDVEDITDTDEGRDLLGQLEAALTDAVDPFALTNVH